MHEDNDFNRLESDVKKNNILFQIFIAIVHVFAFFVGYVVVKGLLNFVFTNVNKSNVSQEDLQIAKDAGFIKGFEIVNTVALKDYCSDSGYVPNIYITKFNRKFAKTINFANEKMVTFGTPEEIENEVIKPVYDKSIKLLDDEFKGLNSQYQITKKDYCQLFDTEANNILIEKEQIFKQQKPALFLD